MIATVPRNRHETEQSVGTPWEFIDAVEKRFGRIVFDLAADASNHKVRGAGPMRAWFDEFDDSLAQDWSLFRDGNLWLNPPFKSIAPWARACAVSAPVRLGFILALWPASVGSVWFAEHVREQAFSLALSPRLTFVGHTAPYPKDLMLSVFGYGLRGFDTWRWR